MSNDEQLEKQSLFMPWYFYAIWFIVFFGIRCVWFCQNGNGIDYVDSFLMALSCIGVLSYIFLGIAVVRYFSEPDMYPRYSRMIAVLYVISFVIFLAWSICLPGGYQGGPDTPDPWH